MGTGDATETWRARLKPVWIAYRSWTDPMVRYQGGVNGPDETVSTSVELYSDLRNNGEFFVFQHAAKS